MGRAPCCQKTGLKRGPWTPEEDQKLIDYIKKNGCGNWRNLPKNAGLERCGKSCRLRWTNYLRPDIKRGRFSFEEEETIIQLHSILGNKWSAIAARLPGRTDNEIKNYWNTHIRKRLLKMGIDPITHSPRLDLLDLSSILNSPSQMNFLRLLGMQNLINPELLRLATSLFSSQVQNQYFLTQKLSTISNNNNNTHFSEQIAPSLLQDLSIVPTYSDTTSNVSISDIGQARDDRFVQYKDVQQCPENLSEFNQVNDWNQSNAHTTFSTLSEDYVPVSNYTSTSDCNFQSFLTNISTPNSSSSTPLNSNSNYINNSSSTSTTTTEDERESYCSSLVNFEFPDNILDVSDYM